MLGVFLSSHEVKNTENSVLFLLCHSNLPIITNFNLLINITVYLFIITFTVKQDNSYHFSYSLEFNKMKKCSLSTESNILYPENVPMALQITDTRDSLHKR